MNEMNGTLELQPGDLIGVYRSNYYLSKKLLTVCVLDRLGDFYSQTDTAHLVQNFDFLNANSHVNAA